MVDLGTIRDHNVVLPRAVNASGTVTGTSHRFPGWPRQYHAFVYSAGMMKNIGWGYGIDINDAGDVTGNSYASGAFVNRHGVVKFLPGVQGSDLRNNKVTAINNAGQVVGTASVSFASGTRNRAFIYSEGKVYDLNRLTDRRRGFELQYAVDINDAGWIIGYDYSSGQTRGFLLTPLSKTAAP
jgi:probable HAF family extracellular repeat protein